MQGSNPSTFMTCYSILDTVSMALIIAAEWENFVSDFGDVAAPLTVPM